MQLKYNFFYFYYYLLLFIIIFIIIIISKFLWTLLSNLTLPICKASLSLTDVNISFVLLSLFPQYGFFLSFFHTP